MTSDEIVNLMSDRIQCEAARAYRKIKKPTLYTYNDLIDEGVYAILKLIKNYNLSKNTSLTTYLTAAIRIRFADIIKESYYLNELKETGIWWGRLKREQYAQRYRDKADINWKVNDIVVQQLEIKELIELLKNILTEDEFALLNCKFIQQATYEEMSQNLGLCSETIKRRIKRIILKCRKEFEKKEINSY